MNENGTGMGMGTRGQHGHEHWDSRRICVSRYRVCFFFLFFLFILLTINLQADEAYIQPLPPRHIQPQGCRANNTWHNPPCVLRGGGFFFSHKFYATPHICGGSFYIYIIVLYCNTYICKILWRNNFLCNKNEQDEQIFFPASRHLL